MCDAVVDDRPACGERVQTAVTNRLRCVLTERGLSLAEASRLADVPYRIVLRMAQPESNPALEHAMALCGFLELPVEDVFALAGEGEA